MFIEASCLKWRSAGEKTAKSTYGNFFSKIFPENHMAIYGGNVNTDDDCSGITRPWFWNYANS